MFRFSTRDMLWLTVVVAVGAGWWVDHRRQAAEIGRLKEPVAGFDIRAMEEMHANR